jgi:NAD/NADP transhydrogenase beta subunit
MRHLANFLQGILGAYVGNLVFTIAAHAAVYHELALWALLVSLIIGVVFGVVSTLVHCCDEPTLLSCLGIAAGMAAFVVGLSTYLQFADFASWPAVVLLAIEVVFTGGGAYLSYHLFPRPVG